MIRHLRCFDGAQDLNHCASSLVMSVVELRYETIAIP